MARGRSSDADAEARVRIEREFDITFLVEAGAGSGKTRSLARRMAAGIAAGVYEVGGMAAVTFTRKAAAELRGRFQEALEAHHKAAKTQTERDRLDTALGDIERLFAGTIHAFCARLLRERPVEAGVAPGFEELDEVEDARRRMVAWRDFIARARAERLPAMAELQAAGVRPAALDGAFRTMCEHQDVEFPAGAEAKPDIDPVWKALDVFWNRLSRLMPNPPDPGAKCNLLASALEFAPQYEFARRRRREQPAVLADLLDKWNKKTKVTLKWWKDGEAARDLYEQFKADVADPFLRAWRQYVYRLALPVLNEARTFYAAERRRHNVINYVDLLSVAARLLRENGDVRRALQARFRWLFIDEFQDTDPIQAEVFLLLGAADEALPAGACDPFAASLRPGALFVVGDPKQSIYRFRRADIDIYNRVKERIQACGGEVLHLTANWRSLAGVCELANTIFPSRFPVAATRESPVYERLDPKRSETGARPGPRVCKLVVPADIKKTGDTAIWEAERIARYIASEVAERRRSFGSFLILARHTPRLRIYADALDALEIPVEVNGAGRFAGAPQVRAMAALLQSLADPVDGAALVAALRGPLFGVSDPDLYAFRKAGGRFDLAAPVVGEDVDALDGRETLVGRYGSALDAIIRLRVWRRLTARLPLGAALEQILDESGWLALAATSPGGAPAGVLVQAVDCVRRVAEEGGDLATAAEALCEDENAITGVETLPLEPGRRDVVRVMNLHKAKGLEADVVFLADPAHGFRFPVDLRIVREGDRASGYVVVTRKYGRFASVTMAHPVGWDAHQAAEQLYQDAEVNRLLYVAATRARDLLVVGRWAAVTKKGESKNEAWEVFDSFLPTVPDLVVPAEGIGVSVRAGAGVDKRARRAAAAEALSASAQAAADSEREARHAQARTPSWGVISPSAEKARRVAAEQAKSSDVSVGSQSPEIAESAALFMDAGAAWGSLIHGLLEHAMRHADATRDDLARLAQWLTVESPELRPVIPEALEWVDDVRRMEFWEAARGGGDALVEVPFAVRTEGDGGLSTVLRGVIDLVYRDGDAWRILDYKSDRLEGMTDVHAELLARYGPQLAQYKMAWERATGNVVASTDFVALRARRIVPGS